MEDECEVCFISLLSRIQLYVKMKEKQTCEAVQKNWNQQCDTFLQNGKVSQANHP